MEVTFLVFYLKRNLCLTVFKAQSSVLLLAFRILFPLQHLLPPYFRGMG